MKMQKNSKYLQLKYIVAETKRYEQTLEQGSEKLQTVTLPKAIATAQGSFEANSDRISKECLTATGSENKTLHWYSKLDLR